MKWWQRRSSTKGQLDKLERDYLRLRRVPREEDRIWLRQENDALRTLERTGKGG